MKKQDHRIYEFADFRLEMGERALLRGGQIVPLRPKIFELLVFLIEHRGEILEKDEITSAVWGSLSQGSPDKPAANLTVSISELRQALRDDPDKPMFIATITGRGYRFIPLVRMVEAQPAKQAEVLLSVASAAAGGSHSAFWPAAEPLSVNVGAAASAVEDGGPSNANQPDAGREARADGILSANRNERGTAIPLTSALKITGWRRRPALVAASVGIMVIAVLLVWGAAKLMPTRQANGDKPTISTAPEGRSGGNLAGSKAPLLQSANDVVVAPQIASIEPATPPAWIGDKPIKVSGNGFRPGLSVTILFPGGGSATLDGVAVLNVTPTEFTLLADFNNNPGEYRLRVNSAGGLNSAWWVFDVFPASLLPEITEVKQAGMVNGKQRIAVTGSNFLQSVSAMLVYPDGQKEYLVASRVSASYFYLLFDPRGQTGQFKLQAQNMGKGSNVVSFSLPSQ